MSERYSPDPGASPRPPYTTVFLSQRDLGLTVPVNYVTVPGISLTAACFSHRVYEDNSFSTCLANLLAVGYRKLEIDLYWDANRHVWSLCPMAIPSSSESQPTSTTIPGASARTITPTTSTTSTIVPPVAISSESITARQAFSQSDTESPLTSLSPSMSNTAAAPSGSSTVVPTIKSPITPNERLTTIGPYLCTTTLNVSSFTSQLLDHIEKTQYTLDAHLLYVIVNIHAASSSSAPWVSAPNASLLPSDGSLMAHIFSSDLSSFIYTPSALASERLNLNASWYASSKARYRPTEDYYTISVNEKGIVSTQDGWPSESYIEFSERKRLLLGWGTVDPRMAGYNFSGDSETIFSRDHINQYQTSVDVSSSGEVSEGCFLESTTNLSATNSSWATEATLADFNYPVSASANLTPLLNLASSLTNCGISPYLNTTLLNSTAHENYIPYQNYSYNSIWSWAPGEPRNYTPSHDAASSSLFRCTTTNPNLQGRWTVVDCSQKYYASCRAANQPYNWTITSTPTTFMHAVSACPAPYTFAAPRTALENAYLTQTIHAKQLASSGHGVLVDFSSRDVPGCWTMGGANTTCPYGGTLETMDELRRRTILVPTIGAIIVLLVTALTIFVKVAGNRQVSRKARRRNHGVMYEGVPS